MEAKEVGERNLPPTCTGRERSGGRPSNPIRKVGRTHEKSTFRQDRSTSSVQALDGEVEEAGHGEMVVKREEMVGPKMEVIGMPC